MKMPLPPGRARAFEAARKQGLSLIHICSMLVFDALIYNEDRHFGNFGVLRDNHSGNIIAPAPIFDNGLSLQSKANCNSSDNVFISL